MAKRIGQYRPSSVVGWASSDNFKRRCELMYAKNSDENNTFLDRALYFGNSFSPEESYYVEFSIGKIKTPATYEVLLLNCSEPEDEQDILSYESNSQYQHLKTIEVSAKNSDYSRSIWYWRDSDGEYHITADENEAPVGPNVITELFNFSECVDDTSTETEYEIKNFGFTPASTSFNTILIRKKIEANDYTETWDLDAISYNGYDIKIEDTTEPPKIYQLQNIPTTEMHLPATKIGIWGHSGLKFMINGEEITLGSRGYYELKDIQIKSIRPIIENDNLDMYLIDYEYEEVNNG